MKSGFKKSTEIKFATVLMQDAPTGLSHIFQLLDQPQTTHFNSTLNQRCIKIMLKDESIAMDKVYDVNFVSAAVDDLSCNSIFVKKNHCFLK